MKTPQINSPVQNTILQTGSTGKKKTTTYFFWWKYSVYAFYICTGLIIPLFSDKPLWEIYSIGWIGVCGILFCITNKETNQNKKLLRLEKIIFWVMNILLTALYVLNLFFCIKRISQILVVYTMIISLLIVLNAIYHWLYDKQTNSYLSIAWRGLALFAIIMITIPIIGSKYKKTNHTGETNSFSHIDYITLVISCCSCTAVAVTLILQGKQLEQSQKIQQNTFDYQILELIDQFSPYVKEQCTKLKEILQDRDSPIYTKTVEEIKFAFERQLKDDYWTSEVYRKFREENINYKYYVYFTKFIRHFEKLSLYELNDHTGKALYFYYNWWRGFLLEMIGYFKEVEEKVKTTHPHLIEPKWTNLCENMDKKFEKLDLS